jgi:hypothetical protein
MNASMRVRPELQPFEAPDEAAAETTGGRAPGPRYHALDAGALIETAAALARRVAERFPGSGLSRVAVELSALTQGAAAAVERFGRPNYSVRAATLACILGIAGVLASAAFAVEDGLSLFSSLSDLLQGIDSAANGLVLLGGAVFFLVTWERRIQRSRVLEALHVLRSFAHIIDMHQLTKDPERVVRGGPSTPSSPKRVLSPFELTRYLDYCSEMLALISKIGALYVERIRDPVTLSAVDDLADLTTGLSRNIWQKIIILDRILSPDAAGDALPRAR